MTRTWLTVMLTVLGFGGGYASAVVARQTNSIQRETARRAETRERVFEALKLLTTGGLEQQHSGLAILIACYESDKLDPDDEDFVRRQLELFATADETMDSPTSSTHTEPGRERSPKERG